MWPENPDAPLIRTRVANPVANYILCRWSELCSPTSPLTVSAALLNAPVAVRELKELEEAKCANPRIEMCADLLIEETACLLNSDAVARRLGGALSVQASENAWKDYFLWGQDEAADRRRRLVRCGAIAQLLGAEHAATAVKMLEEMIDAATGGEHDPPGQDNVEGGGDARNANVLTCYQKADPLIALLATQALADGFDARFLTRRARQFARSDTLVPASFFARLRHAKARYRVYFRLSVLTAWPEALLPDRVHPFDGTPPNQTTETRDFFSQSASGYMYVDEVVAADEYSAATQAHAVLHQTVAAASAWHGTELASPAMPCLVAPLFDTPRQTAYLVGRVTSPATHRVPLLTGSTGAVMQQALQDRQLQQVAALAAVASSQVQPEVRFTFLWMALEHLAAAHQGGRIAQTIADAVAPVVATRAPSRSLAALTYRFALLPPQPRSVIQTTLGLEGDSTLAYCHRLEEALATRDPVLNSIQDTLKLHDAVGYARLNELRRRKDWRQWSTERMVDNHRRVQWQVHRLGRMRNLLIHHGHAAVGAEAIRHLEFYLAECLRAMLDELARNPQLSAGEVFELERLRYEACRKAKSSTPPG